MSLTWHRKQSIFVCCIQNFTDNWWLYLERNFFFTRMLVTMKLSKVSHEKKNQNEQLWPKSYYKLRAHKTDALELEKDNAVSGENLAIRIWPVKPFEHLMYSQQGSQKKLNLTDLLTTILINRVCVEVFFWLNCAQCF